MSVYLIATLDTKGVEAAFLRDRLIALGVKVTLVDVGCLGAPPEGIKADVTREEIFTAAKTTLEAMREKNDRGEAVSKAAEGAAAIVGKAHAKGKVDGVLAIGGSAGTTIGTSAMRALPLGVPKVMVSTLASGNVRGFVGDKDISMLGSIVDLAGLNRITRPVLAEAAAAMAGMVKFKFDAGATSDKPLIAATMFGVTTPCVEAARALLEEAGYEVLVFHATGTGGMAMESLIRDGVIAGVLDITTTEIADEVVGGFLSAGPTRLTAAAARGIPQVVSVGATDMVNFYGMETVPEKFKTRKLHVHNANITLMRTTVEENKKIGKDIGRKLAKSKGPTLIMLPKQGASALDREGQPFDDPAARRALFEAIFGTCGKCEVVELENHINDKEFAEAAARRLIQMLTPATT